MPQCDTAGDITCRDAAKLRSSPRRYAKHRADGSWSVDLMSGEPVEQQIG
jgi:hypothetical protein